MEWQNPTTKITEHRYIVAQYILDCEEGTEEVIGLLVFNGLRNRWSEKNGMHSCIAYQDIKKWFPLPDLPK